MSRLYTVRNRKPAIWLSDNRKQELEKKGRRGNLQLEGCFYRGAHGPLVRPQLVSGKGHFSIRKEVEREVWEDLVESGQIWSGA